MKRLFLLLRYHFCADNMEKVVRVVISLAIGLSILYFGKTDFVEQFYEYTTNILGILVAFSISTLTILVSSSSKNVEGTKSYIIATPKIFGKTRKISLYESLTGSLSVVILMEVILLGIDMIFPVFKERGTIFLIINLSCLSDIFLKLLSIILDLYFVYTKKESDL